MAYTAPGTAVAGDVLTAAFWNQQVRDNMEAVAGPPFARNIIYNGAMQVAQRSSSVASITTGGYYTADRWALNNVTLGTWTQSVEADAPTGTGLRSSLKMLCTSADASPAASDELRISQAFEGYDVQRIAKGTSSAQTLTLSFWVKANVTGTYVCALFDTDNTRQVSRTYTVSASGTWEKKEITFPADTTGAFNNDNQLSLLALFWLAAGSNFTSGTLNTSWGTVTTANRVVGQTNLASATSNYWQVAGVQLETGSVATGFEFLPYGQELAECQRYFYRIAGNSTNLYANVGVGFTTNVNSASILVNMPTTMRATPSLDSSSNLRVYDSSVGQAVSSMTIDTNFSTAFVVGLNVITSGVTANRPAILQGNNSSSAQTSFSAEL
jgi:hypothetical protein